MKGNNLYHKSLFVYNGDEWKLKWKKCKDKDFNLAYGEWMVKNGQGKFYLSWDYSWALYLLVKNLLLKLKNLNNSACLNLDFNEAKE